MKPSEVVKLYMKGLSRKEIAYATGKSYKNVCEQLRRKGLVKPVKLRTVLGRTYRHYPYDEKHPQLVWPPLARPYKVIGPRVIATYGELWEEGKLKVRARFVDTRTSPDGYLEAL